MRPTSQSPTAKELEIMKIVWEMGRVTVRDVYETILARRKIAYTSVMTLMSIMEQKGYLNRHLNGKAYVYEAAKSRQIQLREMVREFIQNVFDGSPEGLLVHLVKDKHISKKELQKIAGMIQKKK